ncbi:uncharacterized protein TNCV_1797631 [Trichonephila clavipes]|nr:uncharacterized protein TNCV_1797631 [Trichonephila clavipes]
MPNETGNNQIALVVVKPPPFWKHNPALWFCAYEKHAFINLRLLKMSLTEDKAVPAPFKNMDIKSAFLVASSRKRKAVSPPLQKNLSKNLKLADDKEDVIIDITEDADSAIIGDCKENTDLNTAEAQSALQHKGKNSSEHSNKDKKLASEVISADNSCKEKNITTENTVSSENSCKMDKKLSFESTETLKNSSQESMSEESESSNELNSSNLNNSINVSELSENVEDPSKNQHTPNSSVNCDKVTSENNPKRSTDNNQNDKQKKKKKMTPEEAKLRAEEREQKRKESEFDVALLQQVIECLLEEIFTHAFSTTIIVKVLPLQKLVYEFIFRSCFMYV